AAVAGHHRGDAVEARRGERGVPEDLSVVVRVDVDETGRDDVPLGVEDSVTGQPRTDLRDPVAVDRDIGDNSRLAGAVDDRAAADDQLTHVVSHPSRRKCAALCLPPRGGDGIPTVPMSCARQTAQFAPRKTPPISTERLAAALGGSWGEPPGGPELRDDEL